MTTQEIKSEIRKTLDNVPESLLQDILEYLKKFQGQSPDKFRLAGNLKKILEEDKKLLERLAK